MGLGVVPFAAGLVRGYLAGYDGATLVALSPTAVAALLSGYSVQTLIPKMEAAGAGEFERYHRQSVVLNGLTILAVASALVASHIPA